MDFETKSIKEHIWYQIVGIWYNSDLSLEDRIYLCSALNDYMNKL